MVASPSWPGLSGPSVAAGADRDGPDKPDHDEDATSGPILTPMGQHPASTARAYRTGGDEGPHRPNKMMFGQPGLRDPSLRPQSGWRGQRLAFLDDVGHSQPRRLVAVPEAVWHGNRHLESVAGPHRPARLAIDQQLAVAFGDKG
jgi:hypothetical protein